MNKSTIKLLREFYATFYYRDPQVFWQNWKTIKKQWQKLPRPEKDKASKRMRSMLSRSKVATKKAQKARPNLEAIMEAGKLLREKGLPTDAIPSADESQAWGPGRTSDDEAPDRFSLGGSE